MCAERRRRARGFSLIEVMVVCVVIAVLSAIAYPSYTEHLARGRRADAQATLLEASQFMQRFYLANDRYDRDRAGTAAALPEAMSVSPKGPAAPSYRLSLPKADLTDTTYAVEAAPILPDKCGVLRIDHRGVKTIRDAASGMTAARCWR